MAPAGPAAVCALASTLFPPHPHACYPSIPHQQPSKATALGRTTLPPPLQGRLLNVETETRVSGFEDAARALRAVEEQLVYEASATIRAQEAEWASGLDSPTEAQKLRASKARSQCLTNNQKT